MLLTDEEIDSYYIEHFGTPCSDFQQGFEQGVDYGKVAQLKKAVEWGNKRCKEHPYLDDNGSHYKLRHSCFLCWESLLEEIS